MEPRNVRVGGDIINHILGDFGMYQLRLVLIIFLYKIPSAWFMSCIIFTAPEMFPGEYMCDIQEDETPSKDECSTFNNATQSWSICTKWNYNYSVITLAEEYDLVCQNEIYVVYTQVWHVFGVLLGGIFTVFILRRSLVKPRQLLHFAMASLMIFGFLTGLAELYVYHCILRTLCAFACSIMMTCGQIIFSDYTGGVKYRHGIIQLYDTYWSLGVMHVAIVQRFSHWKYIYWFMSFPVVILIFLTAVWVPEDIRWLLIHKKDDKYLPYIEKILMEAADLNDRLDTIPPNLTEELIFVRNEIKQPSANWGLLWTGSMFEKCQIIIVHITLSIFVINFNGLLLNTRSFGRAHLQEYVMISGISEILGCFISLFFSLKVNAIKWQLAGLLNILTGIIGCSGWTIDNNGEYEWIHWIIISSCEKLGTSVAQAMLLGCLSEIVPSKKKFILMLSATTCSRIFLLTAPFLNRLKKIDTAVSLSTFSGLGIFGGLLMCLIVRPYRI